MARRRTNSNIRKPEHQAQLFQLGTGCQSVIKDQAKQPQGVRKNRLALATAARKSVRLQERTRSKNTPESQPSLHPLSTDRRRPKRSRETEEPSIPRKRPRTTPSQKAPQISAPANSILTQHAAIEHWTKQNSWPEEYFQQDNQNGMSHLLAKRKSSSSLRRKDSDASDAASSDTKARDANAPYARPDYETILRTKNSFMGKYEGGVMQASKDLCKALLDTKQPVPKDTLFRDDLFDETIDYVRGRNEAMVIRDITPLVCPSAQVLKIYGAKYLKDLTESVDEGWDCAKPLTIPRPQPDYSLGLAQSAFTNEQLQKLKPFVGDDTVLYHSYFMATWRMYFPFLTCEVKRGAGSLEHADRQNAHSNTLAVRGVVELFRRVKREKELHRQILTFSISHDDQTVWIYGHFPVINGKETSFWRYPLRKFNFTEFDGKEKWTAYQFTMNVYEIYFPKFLAKIRSAVDQLPLDLEGPSYLSSELSTGISFDFERQQLSQGSETGTMPEAANTQSHSLSQELTSNTSFSQRNVKKPKKKHTVG